MGAPILIETPENVNHPIDIAKLELEKGFLPITIRRKLPDGSYTDVAIQDLIQAEKEG